jgi:hypothetical protein
MSSGVSGARASAGRVGVVRTTDRRGAGVSLPTRASTATPTVAGAFRRVRELDRGSDVVNVRQLDGNPRIPSSPHPSTGTHWTSAPARHDAGALSCLLCRCDCNGSGSPCAPERRPAAGMRRTTTTDRRGAGLFRPRRSVSSPSRRRSCLCGAPSRSRERARVQTRSGARVARWLVH